MQASPQIDPRSEIEIVSLAQSIKNFPTAYFVSNTNSPTLCGQKFLRKILIGKILFEIFVHN